MFLDRGVIHGHTLLQMENGPSKIDLDWAFDHYCKARRLIKKPEKTPEEGGQQSEWDYYLEKKKEYDNVAQAQEKIAEFAMLQVGLSTVHPDLNPKMWPLPYGQAAAAPVKNALRQKIEDTLESNESLQQTYRHCVNKGQLHNCVHKYCLRNVGKV